MRRQKLKKKLVAFCTIITVALAMLPAISVSAEDVPLNTLKVRCIASMRKDSMSASMYLYNTDGSKVAEGRKLRLKEVGYYYDGSGKKKSKSCDYKTERTGLGAVIPAPHGYNYIAGNAKFYVTDMNTPKKIINLNPQ